MRTSHRLAIGFAVVALLTASACSSPDDDPAATTTRPAPSATASATASGTASAPPSTGTGAALPDDLRTRPAVVAAIADTANREGVAPEDVVIAAWSPVTWNDGSLGCPQEGMSYTQALVDGELLMLRVELGLFQYHASAGEAFTYCATPSANYTVGG